MTNIITAECYNPAYVNFGEESINLYGKLARLFEKKYKTSAKNIQIKVASIKDMMSAMEANFPGFRQLIKKSGFYRVVMGDTLTDGRQLDKDDTEVTFKNNKWHIMPVAQCSGNVARIIVGVVLVVVGIILNIPTGATAGTPFINLGIGLILGGVAGLLAPNPTVGNYSDGEKPNEKPSYLFNGPKNTVEPGTTIPVMYGEAYCNTITVSGGVRITNVVG